VEPQKHRFRKGQRIKLKSTGEDALYAFAAAGSPGWVRRKDFDNMGYPTIYVEWDKDHWSYNKEPDKWALEAHFEPDEESDMAAGDEDFMKRFKNADEFADAFRAFLASQGENPDEVLDEEKQVEAAYESAAEDALELLGSADAFVLVVAKELEPGKYVPAVLQYYKSEQTGLVVEMQLSKLAAMTHQEIAIERLHAMTDDKGGE
jgi:hypothetical protein